ncbi:MAG: hypothetical protein ACR2H4_03370 [Pyrinomonadaceae bacterium]
MTDIAIKCDGLSKQYRIGERDSYKALRERSPVSGLQSQFALNS